jgi:hypothetical protein
MIDYQVTVITDPQGRVVIPTNNPDYGYVKLQQKIKEFDEAGWLQVKTRTTLVKGRLDWLNDLRWTAGMKLPGRLVVRESLEPFNPENAEHEIKYAGDTGVICRVDDQPIYRRSFWDQTGVKQDVLITHTNIDEIRAIILLKGVIADNQQPELA